MYAYPILLPAFSNREDLLLTVALFDDDTGDAIDLSGRTLAIPGSFTGSNWTVTDGPITTSSTTPLTIPDYPIGNQLLAVSLTVGLNLNILGGDPITIADPTGLNTMTGYVTAYAPTTGALICQIGTAFEFEIRHEGPHEQRRGYSVFYDIGTYPCHGAIISAQLGTGLLLVGVGVVQILIPVTSIQRLHLNTFLASLDMTDSVNTRQIFIGQLPILFGGVRRLPQQNQPVVNAASPSTPVILPPTPPIILDAHVDHFATFNLFGGTGGPYWAHVNAWNLGALTPAQYAEIITLFAATFPNNTTFSWSFPATPNAGNVYAYPEIVFGTQAGGGFIVPPHTPPAKQLSAFANLSVTYNINLNLTTSDDASFLIETWPQTIADNPGSNVSELQFLPFPPTANVAQVLGWADHFNFSAGGFNAYIAANPSRSLIQVMPVTTPGGTTPANMIFGNQTIPVLALIQAIVSQGWLAGTLFLSGFEFGFEVAKNAGTVTINNIAWTWN